MGREWRNVTGTDGRYQVSDDGYVRSMADIDHRGQFMKGVVLQHSISTTGYPMISIDRKPKKVHILVAKAFVDNPEEKPEVNHKNGNKLDARHTNLEWVTRSENHKHRYEVLMHKPPMLGKTGALCKNSKPIRGVNVETKEVRLFAGTADAARELGIAQSGVSKAARGGIRAFQGWHWEYVTP